MNCNCEMIKKKECWESVWLQLSFPVTNVMSSCNMQSTMCLKNLIEKLNSSEMSLDDD